MLRDSISTKIKFLKDMGCDKKRHKKQTLLEHLIRTSEKLQKMGAPLYLQDAGLFHSVYGTASYHTQSTNDRDAVRELIGERAEELVNWFCACSKPRMENILRLPPGNFKKDLMALNWANKEDMRDTDVPRLDGYL